jgi:RecG-like helicase
VLHRALGELQLQHGITLEDGQELAFHEIRRDMVRQRPMMRLLQGDVGAGKGLVALMAAAIAVENKSQVAMVFPDAATAERRFLFAEQLLRSVGVVPMLVGQEPTHAQIDAIKRGEVHVAFGTSRCCRTTAGAVSGSSSRRAASATVRSGSRTFRERASARTCCA